MADKDLFLLAVKVMDRQAAAKKNNFYELATNFDNVYRALYDIIGNRGLTRDFDNYVLSAIIAF